MAPGRVIVGFADEVDLADASTIAESQGDRLLGVSPIIHGALIDVSRTGGTGILPVPETTAGETPTPTVDQAQVLANALDRWNASPLVRYAEPDYRVCADTFPNVYPNDLNPGLLWGLDRVRAPDAWALSIPSPEVVVAVIDSGVDYSHLDLAANVWVNPGEVAGNGIDDDLNGYVDDVHGINTFQPPSVPQDPMDDHGHGTHVAGIIGAVRNNSLPIVGVSPNVKIMALRFLHRDDEGRAVGSAWSAITCIDYMVLMKTRTDNRVKIVASNNSWGTDEGNVIQSLKTAIDNSTHEGIMFVAAAGNRGLNIDNSPQYPASYNAPGPNHVPGIIAVAATDDEDNLADVYDFWAGSNYGYASVDLAAPGVEIYSTVLNQQYASWSGTSMAAPFVTGAVATVTAMTYGETTNVQQLLYVKGLIADVNNVDHDPTLEGKVASGGRLNLLKVVCAVKKEHLVLPIGTQFGNVTIVRGGDYMDLLRVTKNTQYLGSFPLAGTLSLTVNGSDYGDTMSCAGLDLPNTPYSFPITLNGAGGQDTITGSPAPDTIYAGDGGGWIYGLAGIDHLYGGAGNDTINGGDGDDNIDAGDGGHTIYGGGGSDTIYAGHGGGTIHGNEGNDIIYGGDGDETIYGEEGDDTVDGRGGNDSVWGGPGIDSITVSLAGGTDYVTIDGEDENDYITVNVGDGSHSISLQGGYGDDSISVSAANGSQSITVNGAEGADSISVTLGTGSGYVMIDAGYDNDYVTVNLADGSQSVTISDSDGTDSIWIYCGPRDDTASIGNGGIGNVDVSDGYYHVSGSGFEYVTVDAGSGSDQIANLYGTSADDTLTASPSYAWMTDTENSYRVDLYGFRCGDAYSYDGADSIVVEFATGSEYVTIDAGYGNDYVEVHLGSGSQSVTINDPDGTDSIAIFCGPGDDIASIGSGGIGNLRVSDGNYQLSGSGFENVTADAGGGLDQTAYLYDTSADDTFTASAFYASMTEPANSYRVDANGFRWVYAYATSGGYDKAYLTGSGASERFDAEPGMARLTEAGFWAVYRLEVHTFDEVYADLGTGDDTAYLHDGSGDDWFWGHLGTAVLTDGTLDLDTGDLLTGNTYYYRVYGFNSAANDRVNLWGDSGGKNYKKVITPLDYVLTTYGDWKDL